MLKKVTYTILLTTFVFTCLSPMGYAQGADPFKLVPDNSVFCVRINNLTQSLSSLDQYLAGAAPLPVGMMVNMQLAGIVGDPMLTGLDTSGSFCFFGIFPNEQAPAPIMGLLVPVTNYNDFIKNNQNCTKFDESTTILAAPDSPMGAMLLRATASPNYALVVPESEKDTLPDLTKALEAKTADLSKRLQPAQAAEAETASVWAYVDAADLYAKYGPMLTGMLQMVQTQANQDVSGKSKTLQDLVQFEFKMVSGMLEKFAGEMDSATIGLTPKADLLTLDLNLQAKSGSGLADMFSGSARTRSYTLTNYLDNNNAVNALVNFDSSFLLKFYDNMYDVLGKTFEDPEMKTETEKMRALTKKAFAAMGDEASVSYNYGAGMPPFTMQEVVEVKDAQALKDLTKEALTYANTIYKAMGLPIELKYETDTSSYKNASIDTVSFSIAQSDDSDEMQKALSAMYGEGGFKYYVARTADKCYVALGANSEQALKDLIDKPAAAAAPSGDIKIALDTLAGTPYTGTVASVNIIKLLKGMGEMMETMSKSMGQKESAELAEPAEIFSMLKNVPTQSCLVLGGKIANGQAGMRIALPKQHLTELMAAVMQIQMQMMQKQQKQTPQTPNMGTEPSSMAPTEQQQGLLQSWIGKEAPELKMVGLNGDSYRISRLKGKTVLLDFWATWCPPCKKAIPDLIKLRESTQEADLVILGLSDESAEVLRKFSDDAKMNYPVIAYNETLPAPYGQINVLPTLVIIDSKGVIRDIAVGYHTPDELQAKLKAIN